MRRRRPSLRSVVGAALLVFGASVLGACGATGQAPLEQATLEKELGRQLEQAGYQVDDVSCPGDLESKKGTTTTCELTAAGQPVEVDVTVTSVKDGTVYFDAIPEPGEDDGGVESLPPSASPSE